MASDDTDGWCWEQRLVVGILVTMILLVLAKAAYVVYTNPEVWRKTLEATIVVLIFCVAATTLGYVAEQCYNGYTAWTNNDD